MKTFIRKTSIIISVSLVLLCSCDMDKYPYGVLPIEDGIQTADNVASFIDGLYNNMRFVTTGPFVVYGDIQTDCYHAVLGNGGQMNSLYSGILQPQMEEFETVWNGYYSLISSSNYILKNIERLVEGGDLNEDEQNLMKAYTGMAQFFRAYSYYWLVQYYCEAYDRNTAGQAHSGVPISLTYNPSNDNTTYLGRNTLEEVYQQILSDLEDAGTYLIEYGPTPTDGNWAESPYFTINAVNAMKARVSLSMKDYKNALNFSRALINTRHYTLVRSQTETTAMWSRDTGKEIILLINMTWQDLGYSSGSYFKSNRGNPAFIPTRASVNLFTNNDKRYSAYMAADTITIESTGTILVGMNKYPGNPDLYTSSNNFTNMSKPFRIAEQYLIAAEAAAELGDVASANDYLNTLRANRLENYTNQQLTGQELINNIRQERQRELFGEGFRLSDLKRWGLGFSRSEAQSNSVVNQLGNIHRVSYEPGDYRFVWPIPKSEMDVNPQLEGQQNRGY